MGDTAGKIEKEWKGEEKILQIYLTESIQTLLPRRRLESKSRRGKRVLRRQVNMHKRLEGKGGLRRGEGRLIIVPLITIRTH